MEARIKTHLKGQASEHYEITICCGGNKLNEDWVSAAELDSLSDTFINDGLLRNANCYEVVGVLVDKGIISKEQIEDYLRDLEE